MYLNFFNLSKEPFQITPDPTFLYLSPGHKEALASIIYGVEKKKGFVLIIGAVGVGKTTILRAYLEKVEKKRVRVVYLFNANISYRNLIKYIFSELGVLPESDEIFEMVNQLHKVLIDEYRQGRNVLLLIDEAQNMPVDTLENLRMLSNLETATEKLIQIVFSGQPEFEKTLNREELKQLKQRIAVKAVISPLTREEGLTYVLHRLKRAADKEPAIFTTCALREIAAISKGIPRVINVLCDNSLITAFGYRRKKVGIRIVKEIVRDFGMQRSFHAGWPLRILVGLLLAIGVYFGAQQTSVLLGAKPAQPQQFMTRPSQAPAEPVREKDNARAVGAKPSVTRVIEKGDTLAKLVKNVYGHVDPQKIRLVVSANPNIKNEDLIIEGGLLVFPMKK